MPKAQDAGAGLEMFFESADGLLGGEQLGIELSLDKPSLVQIGLSINPVYRRPHASGPDQRRPIMPAGNLCDGGGYRGFDLPLFGVPTVVPARRYCFPLWPALSTSLSQGPGDHQRRTRRTARLAKTETGRATYAQ